MTRQQMRQKTWGEEDMRVKTNKDPKSLSERIRQLTWMRVGQSKTRNAPDEGRDERYKEKLCAFRRPPLSTLFTGLRWRACLRVPASGSRVSSPDPYIESHPSCFTLLVFRLVVKVLFYFLFTLCCFVQGSCHALYSFTYLVNSFNASKSKRVVSLNINGGLNPVKHWKMLSQLKKRLNLESLHSRIEHWKLNRMGLKKFLPLFRKVYGSVWSSVQYGKFCIYLNTKTIPADMLW